MADDKSKDDNARVSAPDLVSTADLAPKQPDADFTSNPNQDVSGKLKDAAKVPGGISVAPPRSHEGLINQFELKWRELRNFVQEIDGDLDGELGTVLAFVRSHP